jgi:pyruvate,orthophosphate dikinase
MILAENREERQSALSKLLPMQREDFYGILKVMGDRPVTIRLLDPPLHEFLPHNDEEAKELAQRLDVPFSDLRTKVKVLHEFNPMLGHRGCRLAITYPEVYAMQARAIAEATAQLTKEGKTVIPEIMIPLVGEAKELSLLRELTIKTVEKVQQETETEFKFLVGTMIELPRAAVTADEVAEFADFFSFGTNDLTQTTLGLSRDDSGRFLNTYVSKGIYSVDPFVSLDKSGVGKLVKMGVDLGRGNKPDLKVGICGEHGGDPASIQFFASAGMDYVSCSPFRVPIARLSAAQAALK